jgi:transcriptional regulator with XRE-family HTH domain
MFRLRELRAHRLHTLRSLAAVAGCTPQTIFDIEAGLIVPTFATMRKLSSALDVDPTDIEEFAKAIEARAQGKYAA